MDSGARPWHKPIERPLLCQGRAEFIHRKAVTFRQADFSFPIPRRGGKCSSSRFGERGGSLTDCTPVASKISRNSEVNKGSRSWIKYRFPVRKPSAASLRLRAT